MAVVMLKLNRCFRVLALPCQHNSQQFIHTQGSPLLFHSTNNLLGEPPKKKKKGGMGSYYEIQSKNRKHLNKRLKELEKIGKMIKPVPEIDIPKAVLEECMSFRARPKVELTEEEVDERKKLIAEYSLYCAHFYNEERNKVHRLMYYRKLALKALRNESEELYQSAIQIDEPALPYQITGPSETPPIENYESPDGEYDDISRKF